MIYNMDLQEDQLINVNKRLNVPFRMQLSLLKVYLGNVSKTWCAHLICLHFPHIIRFSRFPTCAPYSRSHHQTNTKYDNMESITVKTLRPLLIMHSRAYFKK